MQNEKIELDLSKESLGEDKKVDDFVNDEEVEVNKILNSGFMRNNLIEQDELTFYDFSKGKKTTTKIGKVKKKVIKKDFSSASDKTISNVVKMAIKRELRGPMRKDLVSLKASKSLKKDLMIEKSLSHRKKILKNLNERFPESFLDLSFYKLGLEKRKSEKLFNLEFRPHYNKSKRVVDSGLGKLEFKEYPFNKYSRLAGSIFHHGSLITRVSLPISEGIKKQEIPLIDISSFENYLNKN